MKKLAITGSIGMGKSTVAAMFEQRGVPVFDADAVVRRLQGPGGALVPEIERMFPGTTGEGGVDRDALSKVVLGDPDKLSRLEALVHPAVHHERTRFILEHGDRPALLFDIPLLFETGGEGQFDAVITVSAPPEVQEKRVLARPGMTPEKFAAIRARQLPDAEKRARADHVIDTSGSLEDSERQVEAILACLGLGQGA
ncbi:dephospho-CoA kinase [Sphingomicrobium aestuariivivum]|uniref:dephospho-CoA kinase n=1 Tax=Sphingomicrobium aestuariivivum TaxID=1582356 RepID=UPI001FD710DE|nr:dephospho-CoA kinase [Sphingomicrobium aestuariivivum]MCJ8191164.1 dephospho-CoA kinase [Sphingomicrobium aestuariivivum]